MLSCVEHGCLLLPERDVAVARALGEQIKPVPAGEPLATLDRYTHTALTTGRVDLPGRSVHAGVWFRLLRSVLDEVSLHPGRQKAATRDVLQLIWRATGLPERGGLRSWVPYENMDTSMQENIMRAAAAALHLAATGQITPRGIHGPALRAAPHLPAYEGERPVPDKWQGLLAMLEGVVAQARIDRAAARRLLALLAIGCRTRARFEQYRDGLLDLEIPAEDLPTAAELGLDDLT